MASSLKDKNKWLLGGALLGNLALYWCIVKHNALFSSEWVEALKDFRQAIPAILGLGAVTVLNAQASAQTKARLVFLRWHNPLPGSEAFTRYAYDDWRVDPDRLSSHYGPLPSEPGAQNKLWYRLYRSVADDPAVSQAHGDFLFARDYLFLSIMIVLLFGGLGAYQIPENATLGLYLLLLAAQTVLVWRAARTQGRRFVTTVLALKSSASSPNGIHGKQQGDRNE